MDSTWCPQDKFGFENSELGQISFRTDAGKIIINILREEAGKNIKTIVEIGTWNGRGSTLCIIHGIQGREITSFHSLECNRDKHNMALEYLKDNIEETTHIMWGSIINSEYICSEEYRRNFSELNKSEESQYWFDIDITNCKNAPNIINELPDNIDLLLLDGGEYTTLNEFEILLPRCSKYILMDDIHSDKCKISRSRLLNSPDWKEVICLNERSGFSVSKHI